MVQFPQLGEGDVERWVGDRAFQRGYRYFEDEAVLNPRRRGLTLISECQGTQPAPYRVEIRLGQDGILEGNCSCPAGEGGHCKHSAALLLTWIHAPSSFVEVPGLERILEERTREELISLIQEMVDRYPVLDQLLELSMLRGLPPGEPLRSDLIAQQVRRAFSSAGGEHGDNNRIAENLRGILDLGEDMLDRAEIQNAAVIYKTLLEGMLAFEGCLYHDPGGDLGQTLAECEQGIRDCLEIAQEPDIRQALFRALFDFFLWDIQSGGLGFADETPAVLTGYASADEKQMIAAWIQAEILSGASWQGDPAPRRTLGGLWLALLEDRLDDEAYLRICRETGRTQDLIGRLLRLSRVSEALAAAENAGKYNFPMIADLFVAHGYADLAVQFVKEQPSSDTDTALLEWLKRFAIRHKMPEEALRLSDLLFWQDQCLANYGALLEAADTFGQKDAIRGQVIERLESAGNFPLLVEIYLTENDIDLSLAALARVNPEIWGERLVSLRRQIAQMVETFRPREAIHQYLTLSEELIAQGNRVGYTEASLLLQRVCQLYKLLGEEDYSTQVIQGLRNEYQGHPLFLEEMRRAGL